MIAVGTKGQTAVSDHLSKIKVQQNTRGLTPGVPAATMIAVGTEGQTAVFDHSF